MAKVLRSRTSHLADHYLITLLIAIVAAVALGLFAPKEESATFTVRPKRRPGDDDGQTFTTCEISMSVMIATKLIVVFRSVLLGEGDGAGGWPAVTELVRSL